MRKSLFPLIFIILIASCAPDEQHPVPDIPIYLDYPLCLNDIEYFKLNNLYEVVIIDGVGYAGNGIAVVNIGNNEFKAYDATCPYEVKEGCEVIADESNISLVECTCCGSKYELSFGAVSSGLSNYPLKTYKTSFDGNCIRVYN